MHSFSDLAQSRDGVSANERALRGATDILSELETVRARYKAVISGEAIEENQYSGHREKFTGANPSELRRLIAELENEAHACGCTLPRAKGRDVIHPVS